MGRDNLEKGTGHIQIEEDNKKYHGKLVAFDRFNSTEVIAFGETDREVIKKAHEKGIKKPVIVYALDPDKKYYFAA